MQQSQYLNTLICACAPENRFAQDAIEWATLSGHVTLCYNDAAADVRHIMARYDSIIEAYRHQRHEEAVALGFKNAEEAAEHSDWLSKTGSPEFKAWLAEHSNRCGTSNLEPSNR